VISLGQPKDKLALTSFQVRRSSLANSRLEAAAEVTNFSAKDQRVRILLRGSGAVLASRELAVAAGKSASVVFEGFPLHPYYEAEIDVRDALSLDNRRFCVLGKSRIVLLIGYLHTPYSCAKFR